MRTFKLKKCKRIHGLHFAPEGERLLVVGASYAYVVETAIWLDLTTGEAVDRLDLFGVSYAVSPDCSRLALLGSNEDDGPAPIHWRALAGDDAEWKAVSAKAGKRAIVPASGDLYGIAFDASGELLAVGHDLASSRTDDLGLTVLRIDSGDVVVHRTVPDLPSALAFDRAGARLAVSGGGELGQPVVNVFNFPKLTARFSYTPPGTRTRCLLYLPDDRLVAANARNVYVFPPGEGEPQFVLSGHKGQVNAVAQSPDGTRLISASHDGAVRVWDASTGGEIAAFDWKIGSVTAVAFAPDGMTAAVAGEKGQVVIWDTDLQH